MHQDPPPPGAGAPPRGPARPPALPVRAAVLAFCCAAFCDSYTLFHARLQQVGCMGRWQDGAAIPQSQLQVAPPPPAAAADRQPLPPPPPTRPAAGHPASTRLAISPCGEGSTVPAPPCPAPTSVAISPCGEGSTAPAPTRPAPTHLAISQCGDASNTCPGLSPMLLEWAAGSLGGSMAAW